MTECPYCGFQTLTIAGEIAHMDDAHPDIVRQRLQESGELPPNPSWRKTGRDICDVFPRGYLPMDCPTCGRRRLQYGINIEGAVVYVECEKCNANSDDETLWSPSKVDNSDAT